MNRYHHTHATAYLKGRGVLNYDGEPIEPVDSNPEAEVKAIAEWDSDLRPEAAERDPLLACPAYHHLLAAVEKDIERESGFHDYRAKLAWVLGRVRHYAEKTGASPVDILEAWEGARDYWYMNYYQDSRQPLIRGERVRVFENKRALKRSIMAGGDLEFRCPNCKGISTDPQECNAPHPGDCDWKAFGLFGTLGKGATVIVRGEWIPHEIFMPVAWEDQVGGSTVQSSGTG